MWQLPAFLCYGLVPLLCLFLVLFMAALSAAGRGGDRWAYKLAPGLPTASICYHARVPRVRAPHRPRTFTEELETPVLGKRTLLQERENWSVHFNASPDGRHFAGDAALTLRQSRNEAILNNCRPPDA
jgi:hypothetical protein